MKNQKGNAIIAISVCQNGAFFPTVCLANILTPKVHKHLQQTQEPCLACELNTPSQFDHMRRGGCMDDRENDIESYCVQKIENLNRHNILTEFENLYQENPNKYGNISDFLVFITPYDPFLRIIFDQSWKQQLVQKVHDKILDINPTGV